MINSSVYKVTEEKGRVTMAMIPPSIDVDDKNCENDTVNQIFVSAQDLAIVQTALFDRTTASEAQKPVDCLDLSHCDFTDPQGFRSLIQLLEDSTGLCPPCVDLSATKFASKSHFSLLLSALKVNTSIVDLNLSNYLCSDFISADGSLYRLLGFNKTLRKLDLSGHSLDMKVVMDLIEGLQESPSTLTELNLHSCLLDEDSASLILEHAVNLKALDLGSNGSFTPHFLNTAVAKLLKQTTSLETLKLDHCSTMFAHLPNPSDDLEPFFNALANNKSCRCLNFRYCRMAEAVGEALLRSVVKNDVLESLNLEFSGFGLRDRGNEMLIKYIPQMKTLRELKIITQYPQELVPQLLQALKQNSSLQLFCPRFRHTGHAESHKLVQAIIERNRRLAQAQSLLTLCPCACPHHGESDGTVISAAILPSAIEKLSQNTNAGSAAAFQVVQHFISEWI